VIPVVLVVTRVRSTTIIAHEAAGALGTRHSLRPQIGGQGNLIANLGHLMREIATRVWRPNPPEESFTVVLRTQGPITPSVIVTTLCSTSRFDHPATLARRLWSLRSQGRRLVVERFALQILQPSNRLARIRIEAVRPPSTGCLAVDVGRIVAGEKQSHRRQFVGGRRA